MVGYQPVTWENTEENKFIHLCNYNKLTAPEILFIQEGDTYSRFQYFQPTRDNIFSQTWTIDKYEGYNGGGQIYETDDASEELTFKKLQKLVKEDCNQFKKNGSKDEAFWVYYPPSSKEEQIEEEKAKKEYQEKLEKFNQEYIKNNFGYTVDEVDEWFDERTEEIREEIKQEIKERGLSGGADREIYKFLIKEYGLPEKPGYPID